ncbi:MAG: hypothetical protein PVJ05_09230 [Candidatus Thorarchaeota archaeon]|jgi:hypothetical protein
MSSRRRSVHAALIVILALAISSAQSAPVEAAESSEMQLTYDFGAQTLTVNVSHYSINKNDIIETIEILKNGVFYMNRTYDNQSDDWFVYDTFSVSTVVDDNLTVTATCSKGLSITRWLIITSGTATNTPPPETTTPTPTEPTDGPEAPGITLGTGVAIAAAVGVVVFLIVLFAWLEPDRFKGLGSRIRAGFTWIGEKVGNLLQQIRTRMPSK